MTSENEICPAVLRRTSILQSSGLMLYSEEHNDSGDAEMVEF